MEREVGQACTTLDLINNAAELMESSDASTDEWLSSTDTKSSSKRFFVWKWMM